MNQVLTQFASAEAGSDQFSMIGIDWKLLLIQTIAFLLLLVVLKKWVYKPILKMLDQRDADIQAGLNAAAEAKKSADESEARTEALLKKARRESQVIVAAAKAEASEMVASAEAKAKQQADRIIANGHQEVASELAAAKKALRGEMVDLVVEATRKVSAETIDVSKDTQLVEKHLKELR